MGPVGEHTDRHSYRVVIVGAGPAGLSCALHLLEGGVTDILVLEQAAFPRSKCCAGYVTAKTGRAYRALGVEIADCHYSLIEDFRILYRQEETQTIPNQFLYTNAAIDRVELDHALFRAAGAQGVPIWEESRVTGHDREGRTVTVNRRVTVGYEKLVFADGALGFGSRYQDTGRKNIAMQLIFPSDRADQINLHFGVSRRGYGWVSTFQGTTNVGLTDVYDPQVNYRELFGRFLESQNMDANLKDLKAAFTPIGIRRPVLDGSVYFVGDALGACDPLTLSGLRYGLQSGEAAAAAIVGGDDRAFLGCARRLRFKFFWMELLQRIFYCRPIQFLVFRVGCKYFGGLIAFVFNHFFVNKK